MSTLSFIKILSNKYSTHKITLFLAEKKGKFTYGKKGDGMTKYLLYTIYGNESFKRVIKLFTWIIKFNEGLIYPIKKISLNLYK